MPHRISSALHKDEATATGPLLLHRPLYVSRHPGKVLLGLPLVLEMCSVGSSCRSATALFLCSPLQQNASGVLTSLPPMPLPFHPFVTSSKTALVKVTNDVHVAKSIANFQSSSNLTNHQHDILVHPIFLTTPSDLVSRTLLAVPL